MNLQASLGSSVIPVRKFLTRLTLLDYTSHPLGGELTAIRTKKLVSVTPRLRLRRRLQPLRNYLLSSPVGRTVLFLGMTINMTSVLMDESSFRLGLSKLSDSLPKPQTAEVLYPTRIG
jgi:hypothetical protein